MDSSKKIKLGQIEPITITDIQDLANQLATFLTSAALQGYATESWVGGLITALGNSIPTNNNQLANGEGYIKSETDPTVPGHVKSIAQNDIDNWNGKEDAFAKNTAFNKDFGNSPGTVMEGSQWGSFISYVNNNAIKGIRIDNSSSVTVTHQDDVVIMTDITAATGTITIPIASELEGKEFWLVQHWNTATLSQNYIASDGSTTNIVAEALHLKSDGQKWYQTNNRGTPNYVKISSPGPVLVGGVTKYNGGAVATLTLPNSTANYGKTLKIIAETPACLSEPYIDTDGSEVNRTEEPLPAGSVIELISGGENWEKIN
jgi:hypothetical protein